VTDASPAVSCGRPASLGRPRIHFRRTDSTNARARALADEGAPHGTLVTAAGFLPVGFAKSSAGEYAGGIFWIVGLALIVYGFASYRAAGPIAVWNPPHWTRHIVEALMWPASIMLVAAYIPGNIKRVLKHPMLVSVKTWAFAHLCANGDLGGIILFASVLAAQVGPTGSVTVVEASRRAVLAGTAALADLPQVGFVPGRVERVLARLPGNPDVVVLDPPRQGAGRPVATAVAGRGPRRVVHLGCDPAALARDVGGYVEGGYRLVSLRALDTFPMTHHVECVALLSRD